MRKPGNISVVILLIVGSGCDHRSEAVNIAQRCVDNWATMGMNLPCDKVSFFADNFNQVREVLTKALSNPNRHVRQRAAYLIDELGIAAKSLGPDLLERLKIEPDRLVRIYLYNALRQVSFSSAGTLEFLTSRFKALPDEVGQENRGGSYSETDERIYVAAAVFMLDPISPAKDQSRAFVLKWLNPPPDNLSTSELAGYWERRWCAVNAVEFMFGATEAIPLLKNMLEEKLAKPWVHVHVPRALSSLQRGRKPASK